MAIKHTMTNHDMQLHTCCMLLNAMTCTCPKTMRKNPPLLCYGTDFGYVRTLSMFNIVIHGLEQHSALCIGMS